MVSLLVLHRERFLHLLSCIRQVDLVLYFYIFTSALDSTPVHAPVLTRFDPVRALLQTIPRWHTVQVTRFNDAASLPPNFFERLAERVAPR